MTKCLNPQCGSYRVSDERIIVHPKSGKPYPGHPFWEGIGYAFLSGILEIVVNFLFLEPSNMPTVVQVVGTIAVLILTLAFFVLPVRGIILLIRKHTIGVPVHLYECSTCGYKWLWIEGTPQPIQPAQYNPNPALFAEQEKRDRMAAMYAAYMQQQQRQRRL